jgi:hypothetical protein
MSSIYDSYNIPPVEGEAMMKIISYVAIENPKLALEASYIHSDLVDDIDHFDIMWTTSMEKSYAKRRDWDAMMAVREFIQNALDAEHEKLGYDNIDIKIHNIRSSPKIIGNHLSLVIEDQGDGITYKSFALGGEDKKCYLRGAYGEGMKVAALYMSMKGKDVYIFSGDTVYKCYISKITNMLTISIGKSTTHTKGTKVVIQNFYLDQDEIDDIIYKPHDPRIDIKSTSYYCGISCPDDMPNTVMNTTDERNRLYVRDMFVSYTDKIINDTFYSYNLWWVDLEPNRTNVSRISQLSAAVSTLLSKAEPMFTRNLIEANLEHTTTPHHYYRVVTNELFEFDDCRLQTSDAIKRMINNLVSKYSIGAWTNSTDPRDIINANHEGITPIIIPYSLNQLFDHIPSVTDLLIDTNKKLAEADQIPRDQLTVSQLSTLNEWQHFANPVVRETDSYDTPSVEMVVVNGDRSFYSPKTNTISISINKLIHRSYTTFIHELSHAVDYSMTHSTNDLTENFEYALATTGSLLVHAMSDKDMVAFKSRCTDLCFNATPKSINDFFDRELGIEVAHHNIFSSPFCVYVSLHEGNRTKIYPICNVFNNIDPDWSIDEAEKTFAEDTDKAANHIVDMIRDVISDRTAYTRLRAGRDLEHLTGLIDKVDSDMCYEQLVNMLSHARHTETGKRVGVYKYDLVNDKYVYVKEWLA